MSCKIIDILSSQITLYNKGLLYHSSTVSVVLSIIVIVLIVIVTILQCVIFFFNADKPKITHYNIFSPEEGSIPINSSSFFHFISINKDINDQNNQEFDFKSFRI